MQILIRGEFNPPSPPKLWSFSFSSDCQVPPNRCATALEVGPTFFSSRLFFLDFFFFEGPNNDAPPFFRSTPLFFFNPAVAAVFSEQL